MIYIMFHINYILFTSVEANEAKKLDPSSIAATQMKMVKQQSASLYSFLLGFLMKLQLTNLLWCVSIIHLNRSILIYILARLYLILIGIFRVKFASWINFSLYHVPYIYVLLNHGGCITFQRMFHFQKTNMLSLLSFWVDQVPIPTT